MTLVGTRENIGWNAGKHWLECGKTLVGTREGVGLEGVELEGVKSWKA